MFHHDPETNRLWLTEGKREPWLRDPVQARGERVRTWLYPGLRPFWAKRFDLNALGARRRFQDTLGSAQESYSEPALPCS